MARIQGQRLVPLLIIRIEENRSCPGVILGCRRCPGPPKSRIGDRRGRVFAHEVTVSNHQHAAPASHFLRDLLEQVAAARNDGKLIAGR